MFFDKFIDEETKWKLQLNHINQIRFFPEPTIFIVKNRNKLKKKNSALSAQFQILTEKSKKQRENVSNKIRSY
jgi:DNA polymerase III delta subunit